MVCTAAYILGEYGRLIKAEVPPGEQFRLLNNLFPAASQAAKGLLMTAFIKIYLQAPQVGGEGGPAAGRGGEGGPAAGRGGEHVRMPENGFGAGSAWMQGEC